MMVIKNADADRGRRRDPWGSARILGGLVATVTLLVGTSVSAADVKTYAYASDACGGGCSAEAPQIAGSQFAPAPGTSFKVEAHFNSPVFGAPASADAAARASLETGQLGVSAAAFYAGQSFASASLTDRLTFSIAGARADQITPISLRLTWHGDLESGVSPFSGYSNAGYSFYLTRLGGVGAAVGLQASSTNGADTLYSSQSSGWLSSSLSGAGSDTEIFTLVYGLIGPNPVVDLSATLTANSRFTASADIFHTAGISFVLPETVTFTSQSGVFLTDAPGAAPEPAAWALFILGFAGVGATFRRRQALQRRTI